MKSALNRFRYERGAVVVQLCSGQHQCAKSVCQLRLALRLIGKPFQELLALIRLASTTNKAVVDFRDFVAGPPRISCVHH